MVTHRYDEQAKMAVEAEEKARYAEKKLEELEAVRFSKMFR